jgi:hypothetical protein
MIIGTHRQIALDVRPGDNFPDPVRRAIERTNVCALTGLDLYCLLQTIRANPNRKVDIVEIISSR